MSDTDGLAFTLYVDGPEQGRHVTRRLIELCRPFGLDPEVSVVEVGDDPDAAERVNIVGTPTVVREAPWPRRRVIGALDDDRRVAEALGLGDVAKGGNGG
jgi:hypothetical protein